MRGKAAMSQEGEWLYAVKVVLKARARSGVSVARRGGALRAYKEMAARMRAVKSERAAEVCGQVGRHRGRKVVAGQQQAGEAQPQQRCWKE